MIGNYLAAPRHNRNIWQDLADRLSGLGWHVITTSSKENQLFRLLDMLLTILRMQNSYKVAQVDVFSGKAFIYAISCAFLLKLIKKPFVLTLHGGGLPEYAQKYPQRVKWLLRSANMVVTPSPFMLNGLKDFYSNIRLIPNPVDLTEFHYRDREISDPLMIWVRAFHKTYNPTMAIEVLDLVSKNFPDCHLTMIGPDKGDGSLEKVISKKEALTLASNLQVISGVPHHQISAQLDRVDIFLNTTNYDTAPRSLIEAMASGLCIVSTNVGGIPWLIRDGIEGLLVKPGDPKAMARAVLRILCEPGLSQKLSMNAYQKALTLGWDSILPQWDLLFTELTNTIYG